MTVAVLAEASTVRESSARRGVLVGDLLRTPQAWSAAFVLAIAYLVYYADVLWILNVQLSNNQAYSYGYLIPFISAWIAWTRRECLYRTPVAPHLGLGIATLAVAALTREAGRASEIVALQEISLLIMLAGFILVFAGRLALRALLLPVSYLLLMLPIWDVITERLHSPFQMLAAKLGTAMVSAWGVPIHREGLFLELPSITLEVARSCSGVSYLIAVVAISIPTAYFFLGGWLRRATLVAFAIAMGILANSLRVALIGLLAHHNLTRDIHGPGHALQGMFVAVVGYAAIFVGLTVLQRFPGSSLSVAAAAQADLSTYSATASGIRWSRVIAVVLLLLSAHNGPIESRAAIEVTADLRRAVPAVVGPWHAATEGTGGWTSDLPGAPSRSAWRSYATDSGATVHLYIGQYGAGIRADGSAGYWTDHLEWVDDIRSIGLAPDATARAKRAVVRDQRARVEYFFWHEVNGRIITSRQLAKLYALCHQLTGTVPAPIVIVVAAVQPPAAASGSAVTFGEALWPLVRTSIAPRRGTPFGPDRAAR